jgi:hypothetical protein
MVISQEAVISQEITEVPARASAETRTRAGATTGEHAPKHVTWSGGSVGDLIVEHINALNVTQLTITNPHSAEFAARVNDGTRGERWRLTWLPERTLTRKQVFSAMVLDEILIAHELDSGTMLQVMSALAAELAMPLHQLLRRLSSHQEGRPRTARHRGSAMSSPPRDCDAERGHLHLVVHQTTAGSTRLRVR